MVGRVDFVPLLPKDVLARVLPSENPFVQVANQAITMLNALGRELPEKYGWRYRTSEAFKAEMADLKLGQKDIYFANRLYWRDMMGNFEAYFLMNSWRVLDLARSCVWALTRKDTLCASLLARSALETAAQFVDVSRSISATISGPSDGSKPSPILNPEINLKKVGCVSRELECPSEVICWHCRAFAASVELTPSAGTPGQTD